MLSFFLVYYSNSHLKIDFTFPKNRFILVYQLVDILNLDK